MNLTKLSDEVLLQQTDTIAQQERDCLTTLLHHLREIESRRLYSHLGYSSLFDYAVKRLRYSEDQAFRRISAMRLLSELPQVEEKINTGELSLTNLNLAQNLFRREKKARRQYSSSEKLDVIGQLENKSSREAERVIANISPAPKVAESGVELKLTVTKETIDKIERLKGLLGHTHPGITLGELFVVLCDLGLQKLDKSLPAAPRVSMRQKPPSQAAIRRTVWQRDKVCQLCGSGYALQIDHIVPRALGGGSNIENLRLLCRHCNQRAAVEVFGREKMENYLKSPQVAYAV